MIENRRYVLVAVETAHIQSYIFASNRLKENVGASYLVAAATGDWALQAIKAACPRHNILADGEYASQHIHDGQLDAEVLYSGGGNIVVLFAEAPAMLDAVAPHTLPEGSRARAFIQRLSRKVQVDAPGLKLTFSATLFDWDTSLSAAVADLLQSMKQARGDQPALRGDAGQGVHIMGVSTSLPAVTMGKETFDGAADNSNWQPYSAETVAKRESAIEANKLLRQMFEIENREYDFPLDLDDLGRSKEDTSYVAVVHADGNGLGVMIQGLKDRFPAEKNDKYIDFMRNFSQQVKQVAANAQRDMLNFMLSAIDKETYSIPGIDKKTAGITLKQRNDKHRYILPIRPLVSGGDDVTFVCDGRIGLDMATKFLEAFEHHTEKVMGQKLTACAGVSIVKTHYPFARAYALADDLAGNAKQSRYDLELDNVDHAPSALDWHITAGGLYGDLDAMREREYEVDEGRLSLRPLYIQPVEGHTETAYRNWGAFQQVLTGFQTGWQSNRNKAEKLRQVLRKGRDETAIFKARYLSGSQDPRLPRVEGFESFEQDGWHTHYCGYYDALELMDKYLPLYSVVEVAHA